MGFVGAGGNISGSATRGSASTVASSEMEAKMVGWQEMEAVLTMG